MDDATRGQIMAHVVQRVFVRRNVLESRQSDKEYMHSESDALVDMETAEAAKISVTRTRRLLKLALRLHAKHVLIGAVHRVACAGVAWHDPVVDGER